jgi:hypothetical protein
METSALSPARVSRHKISWFLSVGFTLRVRRYRRAERDDYTLVVRARQEPGPVAAATGQALTLPPIISY